MDTWDYVLPVVHNEKQFEKFHKNPLYMQYFPILWLVGII